MKTQDKVRIHIRVSPEEKEWLDSYCEKHGVSITELFRAHIRDLKREERQLETSPPKKNREVIQSDSLGFMKRISPNYLGSPVHVEFE
jgi:hypothetical protein